MNPNTCPDCGHPWTEHNGKSGCLHKTSLPGSGYCPCMGVNPNAPVRPEEQAREIGQLREEIKGLRRLLGWAAK